ncbi:MAG: hypothetical protein ACI4YA_06285 [Candidatus Spyradenecus sp.]
MKKVLSILALAALASGCITVNKNDGGESGMTMPIIKDIIHEKITVADTPVSAQDEVQCLFGIICWGSSATHVADVTDELVPFGALVKAKNGAYANACDQAKCDRLVGTRYTVTTDDYFVYKKVKAEISGYPATLSGVEVIPAPKPVATGTKADVR